MERLLEWPSKPVSPGTRQEIIAWWESRRFRFNLYVGIVGVVSWLLVLVAGSAAVKPGVDFKEPVAMLIGPFIYGLLANICYTLGWLVDAISYQGTPRTLANLLQTHNGIYLNGLVMVSPYWDDSTLSFHSG